MSWRKTSHEGQICYEQDGRRLFSTQEIEALEEAERRQIKKRNEEMRRARLRWDDERERQQIQDYDLKDEYKPTPYWNTAVIIIVGLIWIVMIYLSQQ